MCCSNIHEVLFDWKEIRTDSGRNCRSTRVEAMITNQDEEGMLKILFKTTIVTIRLNSRLVEYIERLFFRARRGAGRGGGGKKMQFHAVLAQRRFRKIFRRHRRRSLSPRFSTPNLLCTMQQGIHLAWLFRGNSASARRLARLMVQLTHPYGSKLLL